MTRLRFLPALLACLCAAAQLSAADILAAFRAADRGGVARIATSAAPDAAEATILFQAPAFAAASKLRVSPDGRHAALNAETEGGDNFAILDLASGRVRAIALDFTPEEHRLTDTRAYVGGKDGHLVAIDLATGAITHRWNSRRQLSPAGHKPEDILVLEPEGLLLVSHQKDGNKGRQGSRLVVLRAADLSLVSDLPLPRDRPELHLSAKEAGPSPEIVLADRATNTLLLSLDLYGALAFADLDAAHAGRFAGYATVPTSADGRWGAAFPDRIALARVGDRTLAVVSNASQDGGLAVFDVAARRRVAFYPVESGCDYPVIVNGGGTLATVVSGKRKRVVGDGLENITTPGTDLLLLDLAAASTGAPDALVRIPLDGPVSRIASAGGDDRRVAVSLSGANPRLVVFDAVARREVARFPLPGEVRSLAPVTSH